MKLRRPDLDQSRQTVEHEALGIPPLETSITHASHPWRRDVLLLLIWPLVGLMVYLAAVWWVPVGWRPAFDRIFPALEHRQFWQAVAVGLFAQVIDGALGMAYGITATSFLLSTGVSPA